MYPSAVRLTAAAATVIVIAGVIASTAASASTHTKAAKAAPAATARPATSKACAAAAPGHVQCFAIKRTDVVQPHGSGALPAGYGPADLKRAYNLPNAGAGQTVAIIDAYANPNVVGDLNAYRAKFKLPRLAPGQFQVLNQNGATAPLPASDAGWAGEIALDVDMVSATCPKCNIVLFEANSSSFANITTAVNTAVAMGIKYISNSYGAAEFSGDSAYDSAYNRPGVAMTASTGDSGFGVSYPAAANRVVAVGGTSLYPDSSASRGYTEDAWDGAGSGCSAFTARRPHQVPVPTGCAKRAVADVSAVADPATGVAIYNTFSDSGWNVYGGTSASAPIIAAVYALAGNPGTDPTVDPYQTPNALNDVVGGSNGSCSPAQLCTAGYGWDGPTGLGTPNGVTAFAPGTPPSACTGQILTNPGFESGDTGRWSNNDSIITDGPYTTPRTGSWYAYLGGYPFANTDYLVQTVTIPAGCTATLTYYERIDTDETGTTAFDTLKVAVNGSVRQTLSNVQHSTTWKKRTIALSTYAGKQVTLSFTGTTNASRATSFFVDDVALTLS